MTSEEKIGIWQREESTVYVLHEREDGRICNKFSFTVYPDWSIKGDKKAAEAIASRIVSGLNQDDLKVIKSAINREIEKSESSPDLSKGIGYPIGKIHAYSEVIKMINEHLL